MQHIISSLKFLAKVSAYDNTSKVYIEYLEIYFDQYMTLSDTWKKELVNKFDSINLFLETYNYDSWFENEVSDDTTSRKKDKEESIDLSDIPPPEGDEEEVKEGKRLKVLIPNKLLIRLPILLTQIKAGNNSCKLKNGIRQILCHFYQHNKISKKVCNNLINV